MKTFLFACTLFASAPAFAQGEPYAGTSMTLNAAGVYEATVRYDIPFDGQIRTGLFDIVDPSITETRFGDDAGCDTERLFKFELVHLDRLATPAEARKEIRARKLRAATLQELAAFAAAYPEFQRSFPIVALGKKWKHPDGVVRYGYIHEKKGRRVLDLERGNLRWTMNARFLAVRERR